MDPNREVAFEAVGKSYRLYFGNRALRLLEQETGKAFADLDLTLLQNITVAIWAGLQQQHPGVSVEDVDDIIDSVGYAEIATLVTTAIQKAFPNETEAASGNGSKAPKRVGTGTGS